MYRAKPIRILHVFGAMNRGGAETWIMQILRTMDRKSYQMDFLVHDQRPGVFDEEIKAHGSSIYYGPAPKNLIRYTAYLKRLLAGHGPYDVVHSHVHHFSGWILRAAKNESIRIRIAHSHSDTRTVQASASALRRVYLRLASSLISNNATLGLACSRTAAAALFGEDWENDRRWKVLPYGLDFAPFREACAGTQIRKELGIPEDKSVVGHVGRFDKVKNHSFMIAIAEEAIKGDPSINFLFVGDGPELESIKHRANRSSGGHFVFTGARSDVPRIMKGAMDVYLFPSFYEGLPLSLIEAQAAGLPCVISESISRESDIVEGITRLSINDSPRLWAEAIHRHLLALPSSESKQEALDQVEKSQFAIQNSIRGLLEAYDT